MNLTPQSGMRSYFNGGAGESSSVTPPASSAYGRRSTAGSSASLLPTPLRSSASLPRSPDNPAGLGGLGGSNGLPQHGLQPHSAASHGSNQEVYVNIYQNTNHPSLFVSSFAESDFDLSWIWFAQEFPQPDKVSSIVVFLSIAIQIL